MIVVTTPTGNIGRHVVAGLLQAGERPLLIVRQPEKLDPAVREATRVVRGGHDDPAVLNEAFAEAEDLFWCVPQNHRADDVLGWYTGWARAAAAALPNSGIRRVVAVSSGGHGAANAGPISALHAMEDILDRTGVATRHLRCGTFMENFLWQVEPMTTRGGLFYPFPADLPIPMVAARDIAGAAVKWLRRPDWSDQGFEAVHGPEDLSAGRAAEILGRAIGTPLAYVEVPPEATRQSLLSIGASPAFAQAYLDMLAAVREGIYANEPRTADTTTPTTLETWAADTLKPVILAGAASSG